MPIESDSICVKGQVFAVLAKTMFRVRLENGHEVLAHIAGKVRKNFIKIANGDWVQMEISPYDLDKARITYRMPSASRRMAEPGAAGASTAGRSSSSPSSGGARRPQGSGGHGGGFRGGSGGQRPRTNTTGGSR